MIKLLLFTGISALLLSCKGFSQSEKKTKSENETIGAEIDQLGANVSRIFEDSKGNYWFASDGVVKFDGKTLVHFTIDDGLYANRVRDIQEDHLGNIYFDTGKGINKFDGKTIEKLVLTVDPDKAKKLESNDLWFAGEFNMNGVYRYDGEHLYHLKLPKHDLEEECRRINPNVSFSLYSNYTTFKDDLGNVWMGGSTFGACRFDGTNFFWVSEREMTEIDGGPSMGVRSIVQDEEGRFYFASNFTSRYRILEADGVTHYIKSAGIDSSKKPDVGSDCISMAIDDEGNFWMAQYKGGVWKYDGETFTHYPVLFEGLEAELFSIYKDRSGDLWLGTHNAGSYKFDGEHFVRFQPSLNK